MSKHDSTRSTRVKKRDTDRRIARQAKRQMRAAAPAPEWSRPTVEVAA